MRSLIVLEDRLPAARALDGFAFVEIGVDADSAPDTEALLRAMGFGHVGPHRTKPVQLWQHGDIRVVLNHGAGSDDPEVVAVAVESADPAGSAERAEALLAPVLERRRGAGEADLRRSPRPTAPPCSSAAPTRLARRLRRARARAGGDGVPIERIDHITLAQPFEAFDEAGLFYRSVLDLQPERERRAGGARRARAQPRARATATARAGRAQRPALAGTRRGQAELQHVAFACGDALAAARAMRERGADPADPRQLLRRPRGRLELDPELLDELRELGVLYDRSGARASSCTSTRRASGARVLRGARAARRLRRLRRRQLTGAHGSAANDARGEEACSRQVVEA